MARLTLNAVAKNYGLVPAVRAVDLEVADGEFVVLVGPSGCGKSTLLRVVAGLEEITSGRITLDGRDLTRVAPRDRDMAMVFQDYALYPQMTVGDNLGFALKMQGMPAAAVRERVQRVAEMLELTPYLARKPKALSGGQRQRVALGRALVREPAVFLFDEPLSNLDAKLRVSMRMEIRKLQIATGTTSLYVTHDQVEAMTMADRIVVMRGGEVQQIGSPMEIYRNPANAFVGTFIGSPPMGILRAAVADGRLVFGPGAGLDLPGERAAVLARHGVSEVDVGLRSEHLQVVDQDTAGALATEVVLVEDHGADSIAVVSLAGKEALARVAPGAETVGAAGRAVLIDLSAAHFFHPESGQRLV